MAAEPEDSRWRGGVSTSSNYAGSEPAVASGHNWVPFSTSSNHAGQGPILLLGAGQEGSRGSTLWRMARRPALHAAPSPKISGSLELKQVEGQGCHNISTELFWLAFVLFRGAPHFSILLDLEKAKFLFLAHPFTFEIFDLSWRSLETIAWVPDIILGRCWALKCAG